jgi:hypothetical protein
LELEAHGSLVPGAPGAAHRSISIAQEELSGLEHISDCAWEPMLCRDNNQGRGEPEQERSGYHRSHPEPTQPAILSSLFLNPESQTSLELMHLPAERVCWDLRINLITGPDAGHAAPLSRKYELQARLINSVLSSGGI